MVSGDTKAWNEWFSAMRVARIIWTPEQKEIYDSVMVLLEESFKSGYQSGVQSCQNSDDK